MSRIIATVLVNDVYNSKTYTGVESVFADSEAHAQAMNQFACRLREKGQPERELGNLFTDERPELWAPVLITVIINGIAKQWNFIGWNITFNAPRIERQESEFIDEQ